MQINKIYKDYFDSIKRFNVLWGGGGSGKSFAIAQKKVMRLVSNKYAKEIILRKNYVSLKDSCYTLLSEVIKEENLAADFDFKVSPLEIVYLPNGNRFLFRGMQYEKDREKIKSIKDPTGAWFEEANEFDKEDITQVNLRLRGKSEITKQIDISFNPVDDTHWLKERFFDNPPNPSDIYTINTTYRDNKQFLDDEYIRELENLINESELYYKVYNLGQWGTLDTRGRIYKKYIDDETGNLVNYIYNPTLPIIVCCDFNVDPMKWALIQNVNGNDYIFDEIVRTDTDTETTTKELLQRYGKTSYHIYGDYSGTFRHTSSMTTDYQIIQQIIPGCELVVKPNPPIIDRINAVNWRLANDKGVRRLFVDKKCVHVRNDFNKARWKEGKREEDKSQERYTGDNPIQALIHMSSAIGYYIEYEYGLKGKPRIYNY